MQKLSIILSLSALALSSGCSCGDVSQMVTVMAVQDIVEVDTAGEITYPTVDLLLAVDSSDSMSTTPPEFELTEVLIEYDFDYGEVEEEVPPLAQQVQVSVTDGDTEQITVYAALSKQIDWVTENYGVSGALEGGAARVSVKGVDGCDQEVAVLDADSFLITFADFI